MNAVYNNEHESCPQSSLVRPTHGGPAHPLTSPNLAVIATATLKSSEGMRSVAYERSEAGRRGRALRCLIPVLSSP